jgi:predicted DCC family thiol-disulfide oxidoreductase YuxK
MIIPILREQAGLLQDPNKGIERGIEKHVHCHNSCFDTAKQSIDVDPNSPGGINSAHGLILFDGVCVLCSRGCGFVSKRDRRGYFRFVPIQLTEGRPLAEQLGIDPDRPDSFAFVANGYGYVKSEAVLRIARELPRWQWTWVFHFIPRSIRDAIYDRVGATAIVGSAVVTLASCRLRLVLGHREPRRG